MQGIILVTVMLGFTTIISILSVVALIFIYIDAKQRNKNAILWLLLSIFLAYIPILIYVLRERKKDTNYFTNYNPIYYKFLKIYSILYFIYIGYIIVYVFMATKLVILN